MEKVIEIKEAYNSLEAIQGYLKRNSSVTCSIDYDSWDDRVDSTGNIAKCLIIKKSNMHGIKIHFESENVIKTTYIIPNKIMNAYFGKSQKARRDILEIIGGMIKNALLANSQKTAFNELNAELNEVVA